MMSLLILEIGSAEIDPIFECVRLLVGVRGVAIETFSRNDTNFQYSTWEGSAEELLGSIRVGNVSAASFKKRTEGGLICNVYPPFFKNGCSPLWAAVFEGAVRTGTLREHGFQSIRGLRYAVLSIEETLDLDEMVSIEPDNFPWEHWRLVEAVVAEPGADTRTGMSRFGAGNERLQLRK